MAQLIPFPDATQHPFQLMRKHDPETLRKLAEQNQQAAKAVALIELTGARDHLHQAEKRLSAAFTQLYRLM